MNESYFTVGVITGTHGIRGEIKVLARTDFPERRFRKGSKLMLCTREKEPVQEVAVEAARMHKQLWLITLAGYTDINQVERFKGMQLCVHESSLMPLPEGTYYIHQLVGLEVYADDATYVGKLTEVLTPGANDVYVVQGPLQKRDVLIPAIPQCIVGVDLNKNVMTVHLLPGLLDADDETVTGDEA